MNLYESIGGRKAAACLTGLVVVTSIYFIKGSVPADLLSAVQWLVSTYIAGNVATDVVSGVVTNFSAKLDNDRIVAESVHTQAKQEVADTSGTDKRFTAIEEQLNGLSSAIHVQDQTLQQVIAHVTAKQN